MGTYFRCLPEDQSRSHLMIEFECKSPKILAQLRDALHSAVPLEGKEVIQPSDLEINKSGEIALTLSTQDRIQKKCPEDYKVWTSKPRREHRRVIRVIRGQPQI